MNEIDKARKDKEEETEELSLEEVAKRNKENKDRLARDRAKDNERVKRSYRLKK